MRIVEIIENDAKFITIQALIEAKKSMLLNKQKKLQKITKQNEFLEVVKNDYSKYYNYITQQKQEQIQALNLLKNYIDKLTKSGNLTKHNIEDAKSEQEKILKEVNHIKKNVDSITNKVNDITSSI